MSTGTKRVLRYVVAAILAAAGGFTLYDVVRHHHTLTAIPAAVILLCLLGAGYAISPADVAAFLRTVSEAVLPFWRSRTPRPPGDPDA